ncbi:hypothetical protein J2S44_004422 [Catenuloplanes niger]|uniref:Uncharacterized protein n=1 Tax=Catenuloplanes niger TaxID=587534 RepID=A0AAE3ZQP8_9ACTN|nr:hypothetical protein [Catenuloplanes niger]
MFCLNQDSLSSRSSGTPALAAVHRASASVR